MSAAGNQVDQVLGEAWAQMLPGDRRALAQLAFCYTLDERLAAGECPTWSQLETADRVALIRAMRCIGELAQQCAVILKRADQALQGGA